MQYYGITDQGLKRANNQDAFGIATAGNTLIATVCDGMGGAAGGNIASTMATKVYTEKMSNYINSALDFLYMGNVPEFGKACSDFPDIPYEDFITKSVDMANAAVYEEAEKNDELQGMGTTLTSLIVTPKGVITSNIGDSRIYFVNNSKILKLTKDHSLVQSLIDEGKITEDEAICHPNRNIILKALGVDEKVSADISFYHITSGTLLLCSDGLSNYFEDDFFIKTLESRHSPKYMANLFIEFAKECGGADNITAVVIKL